MNPYGSRPFGYPSSDQNRNNIQPQQNAQPQPQSVEARLLPGGRQQITSGNVNASAGTSQNNRQNINKNPWRKPFQGRPLNNRAY